MWQKGLISLETLRRQATIKHCLTLCPSVAWSPQVAHDLLASMIDSTLNGAGGRQAI